MNNLTAPGSGLWGLPLSWDEQGLVGRQGLRLGDQLIFLPFSGRRRHFALHRTFYKIVSGPSFQSRCKI